MSPAKSGPAGANVRIRQSTGERDGNQAAATATTKSINCYHGNQQTNAAFIACCTPTIVTAAQPLLTDPETDKFLKRHVPSSK